MEDHKRLGIRGRDGKMKEASEPFPLVTPSAASLISFATALGFDT
jgi:hypothetical protein